MMTHDIVFRCFLPIHARPWTHTGRWKYFLSLCFLPLFHAGLLSAQPFYEDKTDLLHYLDETGEQVAIQTPEDWQHRRSHILGNMQRVMGALPQMDPSHPPLYEVVEEEKFPQYRRLRIRYAVEEWDKTPAFLYLPGKGGTLAERRPAMLCLHPTSPLGKRVVAGEGTLTNRNYAQELAELGYVVLAPDYPGFGEYVEARKQLYERGYVSCTMKGVVNHMRGVDLLQSLPEVDPERIGCIGHSLGGHNTLFVSAFDARIKVAVTSCGFTQFPRYMQGDLTGWTHDGYMPRIASAYNKDPLIMPFDFSEVLACIAPRALFICAPLHDANFDNEGVRISVAAAQNIYLLHDAADSLRTAYPNAEHDFPAAVRQEAYAFIGSVLKMDADSFMKQPRD